MKYMLWACWISLTTTTLGAAEKSRVDFNRDVKPILSDHCFACHGPDANKRKANLRFDIETDAKSVLESGMVAIVPKNPDKSELMARVLATDEEMMPPKHTGKPLNAKQIQMLKDWITAGAEYQDHWAFRPIKRPELKDLPPASNALDRLILQKLVQRNLSMAKKADAHTLLRRLSFDLRGLPPTPAELAEFSKDPSQANYAKFVEQYLASPHYGERMAIFWLDIVRYADSVGYHGDQPVTVWPFRDYVIASFNSNKRFDVFSREQLAGDLMPTPTVEQQIASGYNRLGMMSAEGGVQPKEYLAKYAAERVRAFGGGWLGLTTGCAECHDHKFDPFTTKDFYRLEAFFSDIQERGLYSGNNFGSSITLPTEEQNKELAKRNAHVNQLQTEVNQQQMLVQKQFSNLPKMLPLGAAMAVKTILLPKNKANFDKAFNQYLTALPAYKQLQAKLQQATQQRNQFQNSLPSTLVTVTVAPREIRVLPRGNWMDTTGEVVLPGFPEFLTPNKEGKRMNRLDLANWLFTKENPLTARVMVNRLWKLYFGEGISRKVDDLGSQGEAPTHPELLDYLASEFIDSGWDIKGLIRQIVTSDTYQQSSFAPQEKWNLDPDNLWYARQTSTRLPAEMIRDHLLSVAGLLSPKVGGPSAKPYQPAGYWSFLNFPRREWQNDQGEGLYRRGLYTHWQRQYLHPALMLFDAPSREECTPMRESSNTPLQSLVLLNAPEFVEASRMFATRLLKEQGTDEDRIKRGFLLAINRPATDKEVAILLDYYRTQKAHYQDKLPEANALLSIGSSKLDTTLNPADLAAWTNVCRTIFNLHATITRN
ncbi:MAG: PSD1 and planctomycete cytochrome C domain-containing protein [Zavarzinella sp.]